MNNHLKTDISKSSERKKRGIAASLINIMFNVTLFIIKFIIGSSTSSISLISDAFNNLADTGNNIISFTGFYISDKKADEKHPLGYGRYEYISALLISVSLILFSYELIKESYLRIINPEKIIFSKYSIITIIITIIAKLLLAFINKRMNRKINSKNLDAAFVDSISDVFATSLVLISFVMSARTDIPLDGFAGVTIALIIGFNGYKIMKDTINCLVGEKPDYFLYNEMKHFLADIEGIRGVHDLIIHDYGPINKFVTVHAEMSPDYSLSVAHSIIESVEKKFHDKYNADILIHLDPMEYSNELNDSCKKTLQDIIYKFPDARSFHDCRTIMENGKTFFLFDLVISSGIKKEDINKLKEQIKKEYESLNPGHILVINIEKQV